MPRPGRVFFDGAIYHVYNRVARGGPILGDEAARFVVLLNECHFQNYLSRSVNFICRKSSELSVVEGR